MPVRTYSFEVPEGPLQDALQAEIRNHALVQNSKPTSGAVIRKLLAKALNLEPNQTRGSNQLAKGAQDDLEPGELEVVGPFAIVRTKRKVA
jgi:hypothetical protein